MLLAAAQFFATPFELDRNLATARWLVRQAAENGAEVVVLPACFNTGYAYSPRLTAAAEPRTGPAAQALSALSAELGVVVAGGLLLRHGRAVFSALAAATPEGDLAIAGQRRVFLWERCYLAPGNGAVVVETSFGRLGLLSGWDAADPTAWPALAGRVDAVLAASAAPRFHRAVLNFPLGRRVYLGQLVPGLVRDRDALDQAWAAPLASHALSLGVPVAHAAMSGRFVAALPFPRLSFWLAGFDQPRYWPLAGQAHLASLRATFYGGSAVVGADGAVLAQVDGQAGIALAETDPRPVPPAGGPTALAPLALPPTLRLLDRVLQPLGERAYRRYAA